MLKNPGTVLQDKSASGMNSSIKVYPNATQDKSSNLGKRPQISPRDPDFKGPDLSRQTSLKYSEEEILPHLIKLVAMLKAFVTFI